MRSHRTQGYIPGWHLHLPLLPIAAFLGGIRKENVHEEILVPRSRLRLWTDHPDLAHHARADAGGPGREASRLPQSGGGMGGRPQLSPNRAPQSVHCPGCRAPSHSGRARGRGGSRLVFPARTSKGLSSILKKKVKPLAPLCSSIVCVTSSQDALLRSNGRIISSQCSAGPRRASNASRTFSYGWFDAT